jgi:hypothetical protein
MLNKNNTENYLENVLHFNPLLLSNACSATTSLNSNPSFFTFLRFLVLAGLEMVREFLESGKPALGLFERQGKASLVSREPS